METKELTQENPPASPVSDLIERVGEAHLRRRYYLQSHHAARAFHRGKTLFHIENVPWMHVALYYLLRFTGLYGRGNRNFRDIQIRTNDFVIRRLPEALDGFTLLHISDLHLDLDFSLTPVIIDRLNELGQDRYDICVITGDFRNSTTGDFGPALREVERLMPHFESKVYGVLGNHDFIEMLPDLEGMGIRMLMNESERVETSSEVPLYVSGVDDPHFYQVDNLDEACKEVPADAVSILLSHSPETYKKAASCGYDVILSGHTHGGQVCLPGGVAVLRNGHCPRHMTLGAWTYRNLQGYTSAGTGSCGVAARFSCPPEMTLHTLRRES